MEIVKNSNQKLVLIVGVFIGSVIFSGLRMIYYLFAGIQSNMGPQMFVIFAPIFALPISVVVLIIHLIFSKQFNFIYRWQWLLAGVSYSSILLGLINPWLLFIPLIFNPISLIIYRKLIDKNIKIYKKIIFVIISLIVVIGVYLLWPKFTQKAMDIVNYCEKSSECGGSTTCINNKCVIKEIDKKL